MTTEDLPPAPDWYQKIVDETNPKEAEIFELIFLRVAEHAKLDVAQLRSNHEAMAVLGNWAGKTAIANAMLAMKLEMIAHKMKARMN